MKQVILQRPLESHKGNFGRILTIGGNEHYGGAIIMSSSAAVHAGAGLVSCATDSKNLTALHSIIPEAMFINYNNDIDLLKAINASDVLVIGPGLGDDAVALKILRKVILNTNTNQFIIVDGSAITLVAHEAELIQALAVRKTIYTPHQMEWQRLSGIKIADQDDTKNTVKQQKLGATIVLKKHNTTIYHTDGSISQLSVGGPYMSTGGMGDTLTGIIAAFLGQFHFKNYEQVVDCAVYAHSALAQELASSKYVVLPTDIINALQKFMHKYSLQSR
ncbi:sugar kinase [Liquorilactobacillus sucicola DSM 21376 = JCM 15457]|uniref:ADP-dependent (S)-NAD(P)H-hydrate dehydratase n=1 Tax=Liquorilactobacillus sucicola DSM 21376 = JCM 15457 TaxID=1423806 RepID=A0A0R2DTF9_9LACO|nr:sugar kinase [Liquorilactobacillus sucicola DSM 21376 = JCM 15457]